MVDNMEFVYSLSCEGNVFYIGRTKQLARRYKRHLAGYECLPVHKHIKELIKQGKVIKMHMLEYLPRPQAIRKESDTMYLLTKAGHKLCNSVGIYSPSFKDAELMNNIDNNTMIDYLTSLQERKVYMHNFWKEQNNKQSI
jgi:predicted GIY-YIG superfamily endonuclease